MNAKKISLYGLLLTTIVACNKDEYKDYGVTQNFQSVMYLKEDGERDVTLYNTGEDGTYTPTVIKSGYNIKSESESEFRVLDEVSLEEYGRLVGRNYKILPETAYEIVKGNFHFSSADTYLKGEIVFKTNEVNKLLTKSVNSNISYVLPLELVKGRDTDVVYSEKKLLILKPKVVIPVIQYTQNSQVVNWTDNATEKSYDFTLALPFVSPWDFDVTIAVDTDALPEYYKNNSPQSFFSLANEGKVTFKAGTTQSNPIAVTVKNATNIIGPSFTLPIKVVSVSKQGIEYPQVAFNLNMVKEFEKIPLQASNLSTNAQEQSEGPIANLVDNDPNTFFHSRWSSRGGAVSGDHYIQIDLGKEVQHILFQYQRRAGNDRPASSPAFVKIQVSNDGQSFVDLGAISEGLPITAGAIYTSNIFSHTSKFRYFRFVNERTAGNQKYFDMAEFKVYGK